MCAKKVIFSVASWFGVENGKGFLGLKGFSRKRAECNKVKFNWDQVLSERERERESYEWIKLITIEREREKNECFWSFLFVAKRKA